MADDPAMIYLDRLAPRSRATMRWALGAIARALGADNWQSIDWRHLGYADVVRARAAISERYRPATANYVLSALRGALHEAWRLGQMAAEDYYRAIDVPRVRGRGAPAGRALTAAEIEALLRACLDGSDVGVRDAAIVALLAAAGLRRAELTALDLADYDPATGAVTVREGKGRKGRVTYAAAAGPYLAAWLQVRGAAPGPLFVRARRGRLCRQRRLSGEGLRLILRRRAAQAGLAAFGPHDLRRTWIGELLNAGADLAAAQALAGHADPRTTAAYDRRAEEARRAAAARLRLPEVRQ